MIIRLLVVGCLGFCSYNTQYKEKDRIVKIDKIKKLYEIGGGQYYQSFPEKVKVALRIDDENNSIDATGHFERERFEFIKKYVDFKEAKVLDIGANQGYFSFESADLDATEVLAIEGRKDYVTFIDKLAKILDVNIVTKNSFLDFSKDLEGKFFSIIYNLNVIHHLGGDFGDGKLAKQQALNEMAATFKHLGDKCNTMIFSIGFNWKGDKNEPLFDFGTKVEIIDFVKKSINGLFTIKAIGIAETVGNKIEYKLLDSININRNDALGEFLNRPLFILESNIK